MKELSILKFDTFYGLRKGCVSLAHPLLFGATFTER